MTLSITEHHGFVCVFGLHILNVYITSWTKHQGGRFVTF